MIHNTASQRANYFSLPASNARQAVTAARLTAIGYVCWQTAALWVPSDGYGLISMILFGIGLICLPIAFITAFWFLRYRVTIVTLLGCIASLIWAYLELLKGYSSSDDISGNISSLFWLCLQVPIGVVVVQFSRWTGRAKITAYTIAALTILMAFSLGAVIVGRTPRLSDYDLARAFSHTQSLQELVGRTVIISGSISHDGEGLLGSPPQIEKVVLNDLPPPDYVDNDQSETVLGTFEGIDSYGNLNFDHCHLVRRFGNIAFIW